MSPETIGIIGIVALIVLFMLRIPVGISLLVVGFFGTGLIRGWTIAFNQLGRTPFETAGSYSLSVIPLFILMGMVLSFTGIGRDLFRAVDSWIGHFRGGLAMATVGTAAVFSSICGSLNATTATVARIVLPEMDKYKYKPSLSTSCVAAGGTLGSLIPPSVILVLYGIMTREPIGKLLIAGIVPGIVQMLLFMLTIYILIRRDPSLAPARTDKAGFRERFRLLKNIWPFLFIFLVTIGGIYMGVFTATEAAAIGSFASIVTALVYGIVKKQIELKTLKESFNQTVWLTAYIFLILMGANVFSQFLSISRIPVKLTAYVSSLELNPFVILSLILLALFILGCFVEGLSLMVLTLPITYPIVTEMGFSGIWFGVIMVLAINIGSLTPPLGISVYDVKGVAKDVPIQTIFRGVMPMVAAMVLCVALLTVVPDLVTILPDMMRN
jgi:tripartite ATP-independent transporter DctM subunit